MRKKLIKWLLTLIIIGSLSTYVTIKVLAKRTFYIERDPYDKTDFIYYEDLNETSLILSNDRFDFEIYKEDTQFELKDKLTNETWNSSAISINPQTPKDTQELFLVYYERILETPKKVSVLEESISFNKYAFYQGNNHIDVLYEIGGKLGISFADLPRKIPEDKFKELILEPLESIENPSMELTLNIGFLKSRYLLISEENAYFLRDITAADAIAIMYNLIFELSDYTHEDYVQDSLFYGYEIEELLPYFEFVVRYLLTEDSFEVRIINDSIYEQKEYPIAYIDVLPFFGTGNVGDEGFTIIPDGSGIFIDHNNGIYNSPTYDKRIYGSDLSIGTSREIEPETQETIKLPMYGYSKNNLGFINIVTKSEAMTSIRLAYRTTQQGNTYNNKIPFVHFRYHLRERDSFNFTSLRQTQRVSMWTKPSNLEDFSSKYMFLENANSHDKIAFFYRDYLINNLNYGYHLSDEITHLSILGGYTQEKHILGFGYEGKLSITRFNDVVKILDSLNIRSNELSISLLGWNNDGLKPKTMNKINYNKNTGSKKDLKKLIYDLNNTNLYLEFLSQSGYTTNNIKVKNDAIYDSFQNPVVYYDYDKATKLANTSTRPLYYLNNDAQNKVMKTIKNEINSLGITNIGITDEGSYLATQFKQNKLTFRNELLNNFENRFESLNEYSLLFRNPNLYAINHSDKILDIPYKGTKHRMANYEIPFIQLVLNGIINYYTEPINLDTVNSVKWHMLKAIETGSRPQFMLSYLDTVALIKTEYSKYFSTHYINWIETIDELNDSLKGYGIYNSVIVKHEILNADNTKVRVTYQNGKQFIIDYQNLTLVESEV